MPVLVAVLGLILGLAIAESRVSTVHERRLRARGAIAPPGDLFPLVAALYPLCVVAMGMEGVWRSTRQMAAVSDGPAWFASGVLLFIASKALKYWAIGALGERWTFRVLILPDVPLVTTGPYRYVAHPNYMAMVGEVAGTAMMCGARITGVVCVVMYGVAMWLRARFEDRALQGFKT